MLKLWGVIVLCCLANIANASWDGEVKTKEDLALLPPYCRGTQLIREVSGDRTPIEVYKAQYGPEFWHLHHYCWALNAERKAIRAPKMADGKRGIPSRWSLLDFSLNNINYVLDRSSDSFVLMPEILVTKARVLYQLDRKGEAIGVLSKAIRIKPDYWPAHTQLSDYYKSIGSNKNAIKALEDGLVVNPGNKQIISRLKKLGVEPDPRYATPPQPADQAGSQQPVQAAGPKLITENGSNQAQEAVSSTSRPDSSDTAVVPATSSPSSTEIGNETNPHCRFCPD